MTQNTDRIGWGRIGRALFGPAFMAPMGLWASNAGRFVDVAVVLAAGSAVLLIGTLVTRLAGPRHVGHLVAAQAATLVFWSWKIVPYEWFNSGTIDVTAGIATLLAAVWVGSHLRSFEWLPTVLGTAIGVTALSMAVTGFFGDQASVAASAVQPPESMVGVSAGTDILLFVVDGYTSPYILNRDFGFDSTGTAEALEASGFDVFPEAWANYSYTIDSIPSLLQLDYLDLSGSDLETGPPPGFGRGLIAGDTGLMAWLSDIGYRTTKFESGWEDDRCGKVDRCIRSSRVVGLTGWILWRRTPFRAIAGGRLVHPYPATALSVLDQLPGVVSEASSNGQSDFILAHIVSPHPPYALSADCLVDAPFGDPEAGPPGVGDDLAERQERMGYTRQVACVNTHLEALARMVEATDMTVLVTGDHGSEIRGQVARHPDTWTEEDLTERFGIFVAVRTPDGCHVSEDTLLNVAREVIGCALSVELPILEDRYYASIPDGAGLAEVTEKLDPAKP